MNWKDPTKELPPLDKSYRCIAEIFIDNQYTSWKGYCDVSFNAKRGWTRSETQEIVKIIKWAYIEEMGNE